MNLAPEAPTLDPHLGDLPPALAHDAILSPSPEGEVQEQPTLKFVMWQHTAENTQATVDELADCQVVAFEHTAFKNAEQRRKYDEAATVFVSTTATDKERREAEAFLSNFDRPVHTRLLESLRGTNKRITTLDMDRDDPKYSPKIAKGVSSKLTDLAHRAPSEKLKTLANGQAEMAGKWDSDREALMIEQVDELASQYDDPNVKIAVLIGAAHTPVYHELSKRYPSEQVFAVPREEGQPHYERAYFSPFTRLRGQYDIIPERPVSEDLENRVVLQLTHYAADPYGKDPTQLRKLEYLSTQEVAELVVALDGMKGAMSRIRPKATLKKMNELILSRADESYRRNAHLN